MMSMHAALWRKFGPLDFGMCLGILGLYSFYTDILLAV